MIGSIPQTDWLGNSGLEECWEVDEDCIAYQITFKNTLQWAKEAHGKY